MIFLGLGGVSYFGVYMYVHTYTHFMHTNVHTIVHTTHTNVHKLVHTKHTNVQKVILYSRKYSWDKIFTDFTVGLISVKNFGPIHQKFVP